MKLFSSLILTLFVLGCSFDNKSGIWNNENNPRQNFKKNLFADFKSLSSKNRSFNKTIPIKNGDIVYFSPQIKNNSWNDIFYDQTNNTLNFQYNNSNKLIYKSKKLTRGSTGNYLLLNNDNVILNTEKGDIIFYSLNNNKIINKFNFYKKKFKKIPKKLNFIVENNIVYISDNLGYLYSFDYISNKVLWAKNYKIPFRSNLKLSKNKLIAANQNNILYFFDKNNGDILKLIPTEETNVKNQFKNNISTSLNQTFFLNTYGSLYAVNNQTMKISWFINLNQSNNLNPSNLFLGNHLVNYMDKIIVSSNNFSYVLNKNNGQIISKKNFSSFIKPTVNNYNIFWITKNNLLIAYNLKSEKIIYSYDLDKMISDFLKIKKKKAEFMSIIIAGNKINIFLNNSYVLKLNSNGELIDVIKLPTKIKSYPTFYKNKLIYLNKKNKIFIIN